MTRIEQTEQPFRPAQDTLIAAMEQFSMGEPKAIIILHTDETGALVITANTGKCLALGMLETAKHMILRGEV